MSRKFRLIVPMSTTDDYPFDFDLCIFKLEVDFFEEVKRLSALVDEEGLQSVTKFMEPPGFFAEPEENDSELEKIDFKVDRVTLNITARSVYWSGVVYGKYRDICWKTHAVTLDELFKAYREGHELDYRD